MTERFYTLQFDGACSGNPGPAGAGAVLFDEYGTVLYRFRQGLGYTTNNVAEYRALILGLQQAILKGCKNINVQGDSQLVIDQVYNTIADSQANLAINLQEGQVEEDRLY
ncbi:uncharacterized protein LOC127106776 isoform X2 [Lathyrus oleraceus]|uniref:uncharacterized protein LOC127106776 isoform X2 n=1 Tax=Pisum sativum TaxID=3888 RepID=UPI0021D0866D|nr:uncharacterized protein LOC127106776 isoform X2 [Pisum sativum]